MSEELLDKVRRRSLYQYLHTHRHGDDGGLFWASPAVMEDITTIELAKRLEVDYDHERSMGEAIMGDENFTWSEVVLSSIEDISDKPTVGSGDPVTFLRSIDYELLDRQRGELRAVIGFLEEEGSSHLSAIRGIENLLDMLSDLGSDVFTPAILEGKTS